MERALTQTARTRRTAQQGRGRGRGLLLLEAIGTLIGESGDLRVTLERIVSLVADRLDMEVCSIYRFAPESNRLFMVPTELGSRPCVATMNRRFDSGAKR